MQAKLIGYQHRDTVIHRLSGAGKLLFFILVSLAAMISYDTRMLLLIAIFSVFLLYMLGNLALAGLLIVTFKNIYQRPRPAILHLVEEKGFSFPSGHSLAVTLMVGTLIVILSQRIKNPVWRKIVQIVLGLYLVSVLVSRVYLGVHYPSDVFASLCVGLGVLFIEFPFYDKLRFQWRFKGKQK
ncbi:PAP2 superfamily protein [Streptococcus pneumoniae SPAR95]|nr:PAP2 superfamily protein [Streptococcus pneumoniae SPAR95]